MLVVSALLSCCNSEFCQVEQSDNDQFAIRNADRIRVVLTLRLLSGSLTLPVSKYKGPKVQAEKAETGRGAEIMKRLIRAMVLASFTLLGVVAARPGHATTFDLPLNGSISIIDNAPSAGPVAIEVQAVESFSLPVFNQQNPQTTVGVYQWLTSFSVFDQSGAQVSEPALSPFGTALTGYGQNCSSHPIVLSRRVRAVKLFCLEHYSFPAPPRWISRRIVSGLNIVSEDLELLLTLPAGFSTNPPLVDPPPPGTPLPAALPLFATGLGLVGLLGWRKRRKRKATNPAHRDPFGDMRSNAFAGTGVACGCSASTRVRAHLPVEQSAPVTELLRADRILKPAADWNQGSTRREDGKAGTMRVP